MNDKRDIILMTAARLYSIGVEVEEVRQKLKDLVSAGVSYESKEMQETLRDYQTLDAEWKQLEADYLELKSEILN